MKIKLSNEILDKIDVTSLLEMSSVDVERKLIEPPSGKHHYRLLAYFSQCFNNSLFCDMGTHKGSSAFALAFNKKNKVISFDIEERIKPILYTVQYLPQPITIIRPNNVDFIVTDNFYNYSNILLGSSLIFVDISHNGKDEKCIYNFLLENNWKGILLFDDIKYYLQFEGNGKENLRELYEWFQNLLINQKNVFDITKYGQHTGTGLVNLNPEIDFIFE